MADDAGALLVRSGLVSTSSLDEARARAEEVGGTIGEQLVFAGALTDEQLTDFYKQRLLVPQVNPNTLARLPIRVVAAIPQDMAIELRVVPVAIDADNNLTVAMSDPSDSNAVDEIAFFTGAYVVRAVATQMQIAWCLAHYYGHVTALGQRLLQTTNDAPTAPVSAPRPRQKGLTGRVEAMRHKGIAPVTGPINVVRPTSGEIPLPSQVAPMPPPGVPIAGASAEAAGLVAQAVVPTSSPTTPTIPEFLRDRPASEPAASDGVPDKQPRARSISGEIRVPKKRAESIKPAIEEDPYTDDDESGPVITVEVLDHYEEDTSPRKVPPRRRAVKSDPPELAARAGEVELRSSGERSVDEGPRIIISDELDDPKPNAAGVLEARPHRDADAAPARTIEVSDDDDTEGVVIHERFEPESSPILLDRAKSGPSIPPATKPAKAPEPVTVPLPPRAPLPPVLPDDTDVVELAAAKKRPEPERPVREAKRTQIGMGAVPAVTRSHRDTEAGGVPEMVDDGPTQVTETADDPTTVDRMAVPERTPATLRHAIDAALDDEDDDDLAEPPPPAPPRAPSEPIHAGDDEDDEDDADAPSSIVAAGKRTTVMSAVELDAVIPQRSLDSEPAHLAKPLHTPKWAEHEDLDDGWGPPGTTIPPPLLGAIPGTADDEDDAVPGRIPVADVDSAPLIVAPPAPPEVSRGSPRAETASTPVRALDDATARVIELIRGLEHAQTRDAVVAMMVDHLAQTHRRAGFLMVRPSHPKGTTELGVFSIEPRPATLPFATLRLDGPSTLADVVGTRLPYRGPMHDAASRQFLANVLGACPPEILLVPVAVRDRVVGVLFGEHRMRHTFDDQLALASRAAGMALERVLLSKRGA